MATRRSIPLLAGLLATFAVGCGSGAVGSDTPATTAAGPVSTAGPKAPPPAEVLDAEIVYFDADGKDEQFDEAPAGAITTPAGLDAFERRHVDRDPPLAAAASRALADGKVLVGGTVSSGCFAADTARLVLVAGDVRLIPVGLPEYDEEIACVRVITSVALVAIDPADLPANATVQGT